MIFKEGLKGKKNILYIPKKIIYSIQFRRKNPDYFYPSGTLIFCGPQGSGKTLSAINYIIKIAHDYPKSILCTNTNIEKSFLPENYKVVPYMGLDSLKEINNGQKGVIYFIDEIQLELNSLESKNIDIDIITEISQQRKQRKHIIGTSQVYMRMAKPLREQVRDIVLCRNYFGIFQLNKLIDGFESHEENGKLNACVRSRFLWLHDTKLYDAYDTYAKMKRYNDEWQGRKRGEYYAG